MNILVSGLVNIETSVGIGNFPVSYYPIDYPFFGVHSAVSGVGYNIVKALTTLGDEVSFVSYIGNDLSSVLVREQCAKDGIDTRHMLPLLAETPQSVVLYDDTGRRQIHCDLKDIQEQRLDCASLHEAVARADVVAACNINFNRPLLAAAKEQGVLLATDVHVLRDSRDNYNREFLQYADIVFLSDEGIPSSPEDFLRELSAIYGMKIIVMGLGGNGACLYEREGNSIRRYGAVHAEHIVNTVGAGDALFSCFLHFYMKGWSAEAALERAQLFAAIKIGANGASEGFVDEQTLARY